MPTMQKEEIIEIAMPAENFCDFPANKKVIGIINLVPNPTNENPAIAGQNLGKMIARLIPDEINIALKMNVFGIPKRVMRRSDKKREPATKTIKARYPNVNISECITSLK